MIFDFLEKKIQGQKSLDLFYGKAKFCKLGFSIGKVKTADFSEIIAASDLKLGRSRSLIEFMMVCEY